MADRSDPFEIPLVVTDLEIQRILGAVGARFVTRRTFEGDDDAILRFVISKNLHRRHLDTSQRAMIAAELANHRHGGDRRADQAATLPLASQDEAGRLMNVSPRSVRHAAAVKKDGDVKLVNVVKSGDVSVAAAAKVAKKAPEVQRKILTGDKRQIQRKVGEITTQRYSQACAKAEPAHATTTAPAPRSRAGDSRHADLWATAARTGRRFP